MPEESGPRSSSASIMETNIDPRCGFEGAVPQEQADYAAHAPRPS